MISFPHPTEMFQFGWCPICCYLPPCGRSLQHITPCGVDCSIRKPSDRGSMAPPRRVSPPYASFLGMNTLGIHCQLVALQRTKDSKLIEIPLFYIILNEFFDCKVSKMDYPLRCNYFINSADQELHLIRQYSFSCQGACSHYKILVIRD